MIKYPGSYFCDEWNLITTVLPGPYWIRGYQQLTFTCSPHHSACKIGCCAECCCFTDVLQITEVKLKNQRSHLLVNFYFHVQHLLLKIGTVEWENDVQTIIIIIFLLLFAAVIVWFRIVSELSILYCSIEILLEIRTPSINLLRLVPSQSLLKGGFSINLDPTHGLFS